MGANPPRAIWLPYLSELLRKRFGLTASQLRTTAVLDAAERTAKELGLASAVMLYPLVRDGDDTSHAVTALLRHLAVEPAHANRGSSAPTNDSDDERPRRSTRPRPR